MAGGSPRAAVADVTRYFVLTAGDTPEAAIDLVEGRGHEGMSVALTPASSVALYGIAEVKPPKEPAE